MICNMTSEATTHLRIANATTTTKVITIPSKLVNDSTFPFLDDQKLVIKIVKEELIISKFTEKT